MKRITLALLMVVSLSGCEAVRRFYLHSAHKIVRNTSDSMLPTIKPGDYAVIDTAYYTAKGFQRFDMVVVRDPKGNKNPNGTDTFLIKRVIGLGGEKIEIHGERLYIDGRELKEPFPIVPSHQTDRFGPFFVPMGKFFLLGDNRPNSADSRYWGAVSREYIHAKVTEIISQ